MWTLNWIELMFFFVYADYYGRAQQGIVRHCHIPALLQLDQLLLDACRRYDDAVAALLPIR